MLSPEERKLIIEEGKLMELQGKDLTSYVTVECKRREDMLRQDRIDRRSEEKEQREYQTKVREAERDHEVQIKKVRTRGEIRHNR